MRQGRERSDGRTERAHHGGASYACRNEVFRRIRRGWNDASEDAGRVRHNVGRTKRRVLRRDRRICHWQSGLLRYRQTTEDEAWLKELGITGISEEG